MGSQRRLRELEDIVNKEKRQISELEHKYTLTLHQLDLATSREELLRNESRELERNLALIKHELKEVITVFDFWIWNILTSDFVTGTTSIGEWYRK